MLAKTVRACGAADAHLMSVAFSEKGLHQPELRAPLIVQEYLNHGAIIWKAFVIGDYVTVVARPSLCDLTPDAQRANISFNSQKGVPPELLASAPGNAPQPPQHVLQAMAKWLRARTGMSLFGFDVVSHQPVAGKTAYGVIDINYFPGYSGVPDFNTRLLQHALATLESKEKSAVGVGEKRNVDATAEGDEGDEQEEQEEQEGQGDAAAAEDEHDGAQSEAKVARTEDGEGEAQAASEKIIKKRVAICLSYNGALV